MAALALQQVEVICDGDPECEEDIIANGGGDGVEEGAEELLLEARPRRGGSSYYFRTRKDGMEASPIL